MMEQLARHSLIDIKIEAQGDRHIDDHHTVEDAGIALGQAVAKALGERKGIRRYASADLADGRNPDARGDRYLRAALPGVSHAISPVPKLANSTLNWCANGSRPLP